jgi:hypothetical protein
MRAYVWAFEDSFFAVTGDDGAYAIRGVPAGEYTIDAWHEHYGVVQARVAIAPQRVAEIHFTFPRGEPEGARDDKMKE